MLNRLLEIFRSIPAPLVIVAALLLPAAETALLIGLLIPGELVVVAAGICAASGGVPLAAVMAAAVVGAIAGDSIGFFMGRRLRTTISRRLSAKRWNRAQEWLKRKGRPAIFLARFTPFLRSVMPPTAGAAKIMKRQGLGSGLDFVLIKRWGLNPGQNPDLTPLSPRRARRAASRSGS